MRELRTRCTHHPSACLNVLSLVTSVSLAGGAGH